MASRAAAIRSRLPDVQNKTWPWQRLAWWALVVLAMGGVIYLLTATGAVTVVRKAVGWLAALLPTPTRERARFDAEQAAMGSADRERIAAERARSETYNQAFKREKRNIQRKET